MDETLGIVHGEFWQVWEAGLIDDVQIELVDGADGRKAVRFVLRDEPVLPPIKYRKTRWLNLDQLRTVQRAVVAEIADASELTTPSLERVIDSLTASSVSYRELNLPFRRSPWIVETPDFERHAPDSEPETLHWFNLSPIDPIAALSRPLRSMEMYDDSGSGEGDPFRLFTVMSDNRLGTRGNPYWSTQSNTGVAPLETLPLPDATHAGLDPEPSDNPFRPTRGRLVQRWLEFGWSVDDAPDELLLDR